MGLSLRIESFPVNYVGTYDNNTGIEISWETAVVVSKTVQVIRQVEYLDGKLVMDGAIQQTFNPGTYFLGHTAEYPERIPLMHAWILPFQTQAHKFLLLFEYIDSETGLQYTAQAESTFFTTNKVAIYMVAGLGLVVVVGAGLYFFGRKR